MGGRPCQLQGKRSTGGVLGRVEPYRVDLASADTLNEAALVVVGGRGLVYWNSRAPSPRRPVGLACKGLSGYTIHLACPDAELLSAAS